MKLGDFIEIETFGPSSRIRSPCLALVIDDSRDFDLVIVRGAYMVTSGHWCAIGHEFHLPHKPSRGSEGRWRVLAPDEVPDDIYVELTKHKLLKGE